MEQLEEINLRENLEEALFRQLKATDPEDVHGREYLYIQIKNLDATFDMMRQIGGQSTTAETDGA